MDSSCVYDEILRVFNNTAAPYSRKRLVHELFQRQVERTPAATALEFRGRSLTYAELNAKANQLARYLVDQSVGPGQIAGLCVERSLEMVVDLLGIMKAGAAYLPLDPNYPAERLQYMLEDASPRVILTQQEVCGVLPFTQAELVALDADFEEIDSRVAENLPAVELGLTAQDLVYAIYTSGSTGRPKGTEMCH